MTEQDCIRHGESLDKYYSFGIFEASMYFFLGGDVERAKKSLVAKFTLNRKPYLPEEIKLFEEVELFTIYIPEGLRRFKELARRDPKLAFELARKYEDLSMFTPATDPQRKLIKKLQREKGISNGEYKELLRRNFDVSSSLCLSKEEAKKLIELLKNL